MRRSFFYGADPFLFVLNAVAMFFNGWAFLGRHNVVTGVCWVVAAVALVIAVGGFLAKWRGRQRG